jgi:hypothetical protein
MYKLPVLIKSILSRVCPWDNFFMYLVFVSHISFVSYMICIHL